MARDVELLHWQHRFPEETGLLSVLRAEVDSNPVGMLGLIPFGFCYRGERLRGAWFTMWLSVPDQRTQFVGIRLLQRALRDRFVMVGGLGNNATSQKIYTDWRFGVWDNIPRWVRVVSLGAVEHLLEGHPERNSRDRTTWQATVQATSTSQRVRSRAFLVDWSEDVAEGWDRRWKEEFAPRMLGTWRDSEYLRWRYVNHPRLRYEVKFAMDVHSGTPNGLLVYPVETIRDREEKVMRVLDLLGTDAVNIALAQAAVEAGEAHGVAFIDFYCTASSVSSALEAAGFILEDKLSTPLPSRLQPLDLGRKGLAASFWLKPEIASDNDASFSDPALCVTRSDSDQDRPN